MQALSLDAILSLLADRGDALYGGERVTQLEHALQCAALAQAEGAGPALVAAALLHDIGHLVPGADDRRAPHEYVAAMLLRPLFGDAVAEPVRLHVSAKRYLCAIDPLYYAGLSEASRLSLEWQGGPYTPDEAAHFAALPHAEEAVRLRGWDDAGKVVGAQVPGLIDHTDSLHRLARSYRVIPA